MGQGKRRFLGRSEEGDSKRTEEVVRKFVRSGGARFDRE